MIAISRRFVMIIQKLYSDYTKLFKHGHMMSSKLIRMDELSQIFLKIK